MKEELILFNPWWKTAAVPIELTKEYQRGLFTALIDTLKNKQICAIYGLRRVGKSTLIFQLIQHLLTHKIPPEKILYFSFDQKVHGLKEIFTAYTELHQQELRNGKFYLFLDEIQKLDNWENSIKIYYDLYPNIKFVISGSSHLGLKKKGAESLAGRIEFLVLDPLSFKEWLTLNRFNFSKPDLYAQELKQHFEWYRKTPFPEIATVRENITIRKYIDDFILSRIISYDIKKEFTNVDTGLLETLKDIFFSEPGMVLNVDHLAKDLQRGKETLLRHINYLEQGLLIRIIKNYRQSALSSSRKLRKVYPFHPCFCQSAPEGKLIENLFISILDVKHYWREGDKEVDIIVNKLPIEVKYVEKISPEDIKTIIHFMRSFKTKKGLMLTKNEEKTNENYQSPQGAGYPLTARGVFKVCDTPHLEISNPTIASNGVSQTNEELIYIPAWKAALKGKEILALKT